MLAAKRVQLNQIDVIETVEPTITGDEVLVELLFAAVNPFDAQVLRGDIGNAGLPITLGAEGTGMVDGDLVHVSGGGLGAARDGTYAQRVVVPRSAVQYVPPNVDAKSAATVGVAGKTAWRAVHQIAKVGPSDVVLVLGASGGVGTFAAQLAKAAGASVVAHTTSHAKAERLHRLGLDVVVAAEPGQLKAALADAGVSVVLDPLGGDFLASMLTVLQPAGRIISYGVLSGPEATLNMATFYGKGLRLLGTSGGTTPADEARSALAGVMTALAAGDVVVDVETMPLREAAKALERLATRSVEGKLLLDTGN